MNQPVSANAVSKTYGSGFKSVLRPSSSGVASKHSNLGEVLMVELADVAAVTPPKVEAQDRCVHWAFMCRFVPSAVRCTRTQLVKAVAAEGVTLTDGYIKTAIYGMPMFQNHSLFAGHWPIKEAGLTTMDYKKVSLPVTEGILKTCMRLPLNEAMDENYIRIVAKAVRKVAKAYAV